MEPEVASPAPIKVRPAVHRVLAAEPDAPRLVRHALRSWLRELSVPEDETQDLLLATSEAVANVVDHAYAIANTPSEATVTADLRHHVDGTRRVIITVTDAGCWRPAPREKRVRGRGLQMMRACTDSVEIEATTADTQVIMTSRPV
jgi:serine/threonine-protein kinase RsbW